MARESVDNIMELMKRAKENSSPPIARLYTLFMTAMAWDAKGRPSAEEMLAELNNVKEEQEELEEPNELEELEELEEPEERQEGYNVDWVEEPEKKKRKTIEGP